VEPLYAPIYAILGRSQLGGLDFSPMIMLLLLNYIVGTLNGRGEHDVLPATLPCSPPRSPPRPSLTPRANKTSPGPPTPA
jgi:hypothetical protein